MKAQQYADFSVKDQVETPYFRAKQEWDDYAGSALTRAANWRLAFFVSMLIIFLCIIGLIYQSTQVKIIPYIVEINEQGSVRLVGKADSKIYKPTLAALKYFLSQFVTNIRAIPKDSVVLKQNFLSAYQFVTAQGKRVLNNYAQEYNPFVKFDKQAVSIEISSIVKLSKNSYQVRWKEQVYYQNGMPSGINNFVGIFNLEINQPRSENILKVNPLGIYIDFFSISRTISNEKNNNDNGFN